jgi:hypothetical protein
MRVKSEPEALFEQDFSSDGENFYRAHNTQSKMIPLGPGGPFFEKFHHATQTEYLRQPTTINLG